MTTSAQDSFPTALLITQCLQNDFVAPIGRYEALPNQLHVGYDEAIRLIGLDPQQGPVQTVMDWAYQQDLPDLGIVHIRDWHNPSDPEQQAHLEQFGPHCIQNSDGAAFVFESAISNSSRHTIVDASGLNDFHQTSLEGLLSQWIQGQKGTPKPLRLGIMGVWTEAKISFLAYELATRYPGVELAVCSALTASSSRTSHFIALERMQSILGVRVYSSVASFTEFLTGKQPGIRHKLKHSRLAPERLALPAGFSLQDQDQTLLLYLFRESSSLQARVLDGGFSGNVVLRITAQDIYGQKQVPHVVKIGPRDLIAQERSAFERVEDVLGNSAPAVVDFAETSDRGAIKYRYAGMLDGAVASFQRLYMSGADGSEIERVLHTVCREQLGRFYEAATMEPLDLMRYYDFNPRYADGVRRRVEALLPDAGKTDLSGETLAYFGNTDIPNVIRFYAQDLNTMTERPGSRHYVAWLHGDLNGANILIDGSGNVWLIDFFHTHRGHVLKDLIKLENDLLYIFTIIESEGELLEAMHLSDLLAACADLGSGLEPAHAADFRLPQLKRAWLSLVQLRSYYPPLVELDRDPWQLYVGLLRYAMHTLSFDECNIWQKRWALYAGSLWSARVRAGLQVRQQLRVDLVEQSVYPGSLGITILPGRQDRGRNLSADLQRLQELRYQNIVCLLTANEFEDYGVPDLLQQYEQAEFETLHFPVPDQGIPPLDADWQSVMEWIAERLDRGQNVLIHCVGGLGRSGLIAALFLKHKSGMGAEEAVAHVRQCRSPRAIETRRQLEFVTNH
ncbi:MAG: isochorismatase family protein [Leptospiraceae bacterium]|nr:isochorismatase family protein [Leptospiraceae bacterium]